MGTDVFVKEKKRLMKNGMQQPVTLGWRAKGGMRSLTFA